MTKFTTLILTAALSTVAHLSMAAAPNETFASQSPPRLLVRYADLDLSRPEGAAMLFRRVQTAAKIVCSPLESKDPAQFTMFQRCTADAMARAVTQIDRPALDAYYRAKAQGNKTGRIEVASNERLTR